MISSQSQLLVDTGIAIQKALDNTTEIALKELIRLIDAEVYSYDATWTNGSSENGFGRTKEWRDTWDRTKATLATVGNTNEAKAQIGQMIELQWHQPFSHGSIIEGEPISSTNLNTIINEGLRNTGINFPAMAPRPFWSDFEKWCENNLVSVFKSECSKQGLNVGTTLSYSL